MPEESNKKEVKYSTKFEDDKDITPYLAAGIAEGFEESDNPKDEIHAWSYLIGTGQAYQLQGWYGRNANSLIEAGWFDKDGTILKEA